MIPKRYALYYAPDGQAPWAAFAARWLGWDSASGAALPHPDLGLPLEEITATPRKYGLHATMKPPFRLVAMRSRAQLEAACAELAARQGPVTLDGLELSRLGRFLALCPTGDHSALNALAAACVRDLDAFRAPPSAAELTRRRGKGLSAEREANLQRWGYPHVMEAFRFHITLTGRLDDETRDRALEALHAHLTPLLPRPFVIRDLVLMGEDSTGRFHQLRRFALGG